LNGLIAREATMLHGFVLSLLLSSSAAAGGAPTAKQHPVVLKSTTIDLRVTRVLAEATCAAEAVRLDGVVHLELRTLTRPGGAKLTSVSPRLADVGVTGQASGAGYRLDDLGRGTQARPCGPGDPCLRGLRSAFVVAGTGPADGQRGHFLIELSLLGGREPFGRVVDVQLDCDPR
jgi:hypothetical protein